MPRYRVNSMVEDGEILICIEKRVSAENYGTTYTRIYGDLNNVYIKPPSILGVLMGKTIDREVKKTVKEMEARCLSLAAEDLAKERKHDDLEMILNRSGMKRC